MFVFAASYGRASKEKNTLLNTVSIDYCMASSNDQPRSDPTAPYHDALQDLLQVCSGLKRIELERAASRLTVRQLY